MDVDIHASPRRPFLAAAQRGARRSTFPCVAMLAYGCAGLALLPSTAACSREPSPQASAAVGDAAVGDAAATASVVVLGVELRALDTHYGVYLNGQKVGWMRTRLLPGASVVLTTQLQARVSGLGQVSAVELHEERAYDASNGQLERLSFLQQAAAGTVQVDGHRVGAGLSVDVVAGGMRRTQRFEGADTLADALAVQRLVARAKVGESIETTHFDPSLLQAVRAQHRVLSVEAKLFAGVTAQAVQVETSYPSLGVTETSWLDATGNVLESRIGGFFVARIEPPDVAKRLDYQQDLLVSAVVRAPTSVRAARSLYRMSLVFSGFGDMLPPASERQQVTALPQARVRLDLQRDPSLPTTPWSFPVLGSSASAADDEFLQATAFIQSDAMAIRQAAQGALADASDVGTAVIQLVHFVDRHVRDEYVPAYSNALDALNSGRGDCTEHAILFVALARAAGIASRVAVGIAYWPPGGGFGWHAWAEVRIGGRWYTVDPTWDEPIADVTHIKLAEGGPAEQARIVMLLGQLKIDDMRFTSP